MENVGARGARPLAVQREEKCGYKEISTKFQASNKQQYPIIKSQTFCWNVTL
jgi:hypothetical protein